MFFFTDADESIIDALEITSSYEIVQLFKNDFEWKNIFLMSKCKHFIADDSATSWWAAWLNFNNDRKVILPQNFSFEIPENYTQTNWVFNKTGLRYKKMTADKKEWTEIIESSSNSFKINLKELVEYKDLLLMFVRRDFVATYKQTILGPLWFFIQPILTTLMFTVVFGKFANLKTDIEPKFLFYFFGSSYLELFF